MHQYHVTASDTVEYHIFYIDDGNAPIFDNEPNNLDLELGVDSGEISWNATDDTPRYYYVNGGSATSYTSGTMYSVSIPNTLSTGTHQYDITVDDRDGRTTTRSAYVIVSDTLGPNIENIPSDVVLDYGDNDQIDWLFTDHDNIHTGTYSIMNGTYNQIAFGILKKKVVINKIIIIYRIKTIPAMITNKPPRSFENRTAIIPNIIMVTALKPILDLRLLPDNAESKITIPNMIDNIPHTINSNVGIKSNSKK